jgi:hypothetical protein
MVKRENETGICSLFNTACRKFLSAYPLPEISEIPEITPARGKHRSHGGETS